MSWDRYADLVARRWNALLQHPPEDELSLQRFLEAHPCLLPFALEYTPAGDPRYGHHGTIHGAVFRQPRFPETAIELRPDFMRITRDSRSTHITLFELKGARRPLFRSDGLFRDVFDSARAQLQGYSAWLEDADNWGSFARAYSLPSYVEHREIEIRLVLLAGRRREIYQHPASRDRRQRESIVSMSFDSLRPDSNARNDIVVRRSGLRLVAVSVPPTLRLGPGNSDGLRLMTGLAAAVEANPDLSDARKAFLIDRIPHWKAFARRPPLIHRSGYWE
jgi:hypothetical protein